MNRKRRWPMTAARLSREPVMKLSMPITSQSCASRNSHRWDPMNPATPVTSTRIVALRLVCSARGSGGQDGLAADRVVLEPQAAHPLRLPDVAAVEEHRPPHDAAQPLQVQELELVPL